MNTINWKNASPEQLLLWQHASTLIAYTTITPLVFMGNIAGSEFLTYNAGKLYICLKALFDDGGSTAVYCDISFYTPGDVLSFVASNNSYALTAADADRFQGNNLKIDNFYFSRLVAAEYARMFFCGYRLNA